MPVADGLTKARASTAAEESAHGVHAPAGDVRAKRPDWQAWRQVWGRGPARGLPTRCRCFCAQPPGWAVRRPASAAGGGGIQRSGFRVALTCGTLSRSSITRAEVDLGEQRRRARGCSSARRARPALLGCCPEAVACGRNAAACEGLPFATDQVLEREPARHRDRRAVALVQGVDGAEAPVAGGGGPPWSPWVRFPAAQRADRFASPLDRLAWRSRGYRSLRRATHA